MRSNFFLNWKISDKELSNLITFGEKNDSAADKICAFLLAISPILQHYKGIGLNAGFWILIIVFPYMFLKMWTKLSDLRIYFIGAVIPLILFQLYKTTGILTDITGLAHVAVIIFYYVAAGSGCINIKFFVKILCYVTAAASILLMVQYICYYLAGFHLQLVPTGLLLEESEQWVMLAQTGLVGVTGRNLSYYRPSAFFLEPSHFFIYSFPILLILLLAPRMTSWRLKMAALVTIGLFLSTSGMGICIAIGSWILYLMLFRGGDNTAKFYKLFNPVNIMLITGFFAFLVVLYFVSDFFRLSIERISSAISGRTRGAISILKDLEGLSFMFGSSNTSSIPDVHKAGFFSTLYNQGIVGIIFSYAFYVLGIFRLKAQYFWLNIIIILLSFFTAHTHGTFYMLCYVIILMDGYHVLKSSGKSSGIAKEIIVETTEDT